MSEPKRVREVDSEESEGETSPKKSLVEPEPKLTPEQAEGKRRYDLFWENIGYFEQGFAKLSMEELYVLGDFARAGLVQLVGEENYRTDPEYFKELTNKQNDTNVSVFLTPRRFGKDTVCDFYAAALLLTVPDARVTFLYTSPYDAGAMLTKISELISKFKRYPVDITRSTRTTIIVNVGEEALSNTRECRAFAATTASVKGCDWGFCILNNFVYGGYSFWQEVITPLVGSEHTSFVAIGTPLDAVDDWYSDIIETKQYKMGPAETKKAGDEDEGFRPSNYVFSVNRIEKPLPAAAAEAPPPYTA